MMGSHPGLSIIPLLCAVVLAIKFGQVYIALFAGSVSGTTIPTNGNVLKGAIDTIERCVRVFEDVSNVKTSIFCIFVGATVAFTQHSGSAPICSLIPISARGAFYSPDYWRTG